MGTFYVLASLSASDFKELAGRTQRFSQSCARPIRKLFLSFFFYELLLPLPPELSMTLRMLPP
jgi:hypothetical protein